MGGAPHDTESQLREEIAQLSQHNRELQFQLDAMNTGTLADSQGDNQKLRQELHTKDDMLAARQRELAARQRENQQLKQELHTKEESLVARQREAKQKPLQQPKQQPQAIPQTAKSEKHPKQEPKLSPPPHGMQRGAAADGNV